MATDTVHETEQEIEMQMENLLEGGDSPLRSEYGKLMMWYFLLSDAFTFAGFLIAYGSLRFSMNAWPVPDHVFSTTPFGGEGMPLIFVTIMTFVLIVSSVTVLRAVQEGKLENSMGVVKWMVATIIGGAIFLGCQAWEWTNLIGVEGVTIYNNPFSSHLDDGTYITLEEAKKMNPNLVEGSLTVSVHGADGAHTDTEVPYLMDPIKEERYFEKVDHHFFHHKEGHEAKEYVGKGFEVGDPYLIAYNEGNYFPGAYKIDGTNAVMTEAMGPTAFGALFFFITGFHGFHVFSGLVILLIITLGAWSGVYRARNNGHIMVEKVGLYWHFVDLVWVFVFLAFYLL